MLTKMNTMSLDLHTAAKNGDVVKVRRWVEDRGTPVDSRKEGYTPLHKACQGGSLEVVQCLIALGADIHAKSFANYTALHLSAQQGSVDVVRFLIERGADPTARLDNGKTPLQLAQEAGFEEVTKYLFKIVGDEDGNRTSKRHSIGADSPSTIQKGKSPVVALRESRRHSSSATNLHVLGGSPASSPKTPAKNAGSPPAQHLHLSFDEDLLPPPASVAKSWVAYSPRGHASPSQAWNGTPPLARHTSAPADGGSSARSAPAQDHIEPQNEAPNPTEESANSCSLF